MRLRPLFRGVRGGPVTPWPLALAATVWLARSIPTTAADIVDRTVPSVTYHAGFHDLYDGDYKSALDRFERELRGAIKTPASRWIDSICYYTMIGECHYRMGSLDKALSYYEEALKLYLVFPDWMLRLSNVPPTIRPAQVSRTRQPTWGASKRTPPPRPGQFSRSMLISQGRIDQNEVFQQGGVVQMAQYFPVDAREIVRCTTLAIRRRTELLGPLCPHSPLTAQLIAAVSRPIAPPNHWLQTWGDVQQALALVAGGKVDQAIPLLNRAIVAAGEYDHPLTATAQLELGRLALLRGEYSAASLFLHEATLSAVDFPDPGLLEEAFRHAAVAHLAANRGGMFPMLEPAAQWARAENLRELRASLLLSAAENRAVLGQTAPAAALLDEARQTMARQVMAAGRLGAQLNYLNALVLFQQRNIAAGDASLVTAMQYMQRGSRWLFQIGYLDRRYAAGEIGTRGPITPRSAMELYGEVLRDPQPADWGLDPMESLAAMTVPHPESWENWFRIALDRKEYEAALEIADRARRHRFWSSLGYGGRLLALRWVLEASDVVLDRQAQLNRQDLLADYPAYRDLSRQARELRAALAREPLAPADSDAFRRMQERLKTLESLSVGQEAILREMAVRREAASLVFPPIRSTREIQQSLPEGHVLLAFFAAGGELYAFLLNRDNYDYWKVKGAGAGRASPLARQTVELLRAMGQYDPNYEMSLKELADTSWQQPAEQLLKTLLDGSRADFTAGFPELIVVPDGLVWYVPFESLVVDVEGQKRPLVARFRIRYAPLASLAVPDARQPSPTSATAVVLGRLFPRHDDAVAQNAYQELAKVVPRTAPLSKSPLPGPSAVYASLMSRLVVLDDLRQDFAAPYGLAPIPIDQNKPGNSLNDWLGLPWGKPGVVVLPGFHTAAENSLKGVGPAAGHEVFLSVCGLMATGVRTILISRWRTGGQTSFDVVREFAQELPHTTPAEALQRALLLAADSQLDVEAEPRVKRSSGADPLKATHPFFWSGYMLVDSGLPPEVAEPKEEPRVIEFEPSEKRRPKQGEPLQPAPPTEPPLEEPPPEERF